MSMPHRRRSPDVGKPYRHRKQSGIIPVIQQDRLAGREPEKAIEQIEHFIGLETHTILTSAKTGVGVPEVLEAIVREVPPPKGDPDAPLKALIFDSWYDSYRGVIVLFRVIDGTIRPGMKIRFFNAGRDYQVETLGVNRPRPTPIDQLSVGEVGFLTASIKAVADVQIGDTVTEAARPTKEPFPGYQEIKPMVFAGLYPIDTNQYEELRDAMDKLRLNDASFFYEPESSTALGFGFRCGFLGLLHMEIVQERLEREFNLDLITTAPGVRYIVTTSDGKLRIDSPAKCPTPVALRRLKNPRYAPPSTPEEHWAPSRLLEARGQQKGLLHHLRMVMLTYELPLQEIVLDFTIV